MVWIKICGFCDTESAVLAAELGADAIGLNFVARSKRFVSIDAARRIVESLRGRIELVGVVESITIEQSESLRREVGLDRIQIHGSPVHASSQLPSWAYRVIGVSPDSDAVNLMDIPGDPLLVDTAVAGVTGGTGKCFDWSMVSSAAQRRRVIVAGGLNPNNVAQAISSARPFGVDVASGVELAERPGYKDAQLMQAFILNARAAEQAVREH